MVGERWYIMKRSDFSKFKEVISNARNDDPIWWAGYLWINLTEKQSNEVIKILTSRGFRTSANEITIPSGIKFTIADC